MSIASLTFPRVFTSPQKSKDFRKHLPEIISRGGLETDSYLCDLYSLRYRVYCNELGTLPACKYQLPLETDESDPHSQHFIAIRDTKIVSGVRLTLPRENTAFPFQTEFNGAPGLDSPAHMKSAEISKWITDKICRRRTGDTVHGISIYDTRLLRDSGYAKNYSQNQLVVLSLFRAMYRFSQQCGIRYWYLSTNELIHYSLCQLGIIFEPINLNDPLKGLFRADLSQFKTHLYARDVEFATWFLREKCIVS